MDKHDKAEFEVDFQSSTANMKRSRITLIAQPLLYTIILLFLIRIVFSK